MIIPARYPNLQSKTTTYTATAADDVLVCDTTGGAWTLTLPSAAAYLGRCIEIIKTGTAANALTVSRAGSDTIYTSVSSSFPMTGNRNRCVLRATSSTVWTPIVYPNLTYIAKRPAADTQSFSQTTWSTLIFNSLFASSNAFNPGGAYNTTTGVLSVPFIGIWSIDATAYFNAAASMAIYCDTNMQRAVGSAGAVQNKISASVYAEESIEIKGYSGNATPQMQPGSNALESMISAHFVGPL